MDKVFNLACSSVSSFFPGLAILFAIIVVCLSFNSNYLGKKPIDQSR